MKGRIESLESVDWILCDLGKTVIDFDHRLALRALKQRLREEPHRSEGRAPNFLVLSQFLFFPFEGRFSRSYLLETGRRDLDWLSGELEKHLGLLFSPGDLEDILSNIFTRKHHHVINAVKRSRSTGIRVGIASDLIESHWKYLVENLTELRGMWDTAFLSFELGCLKREPPFFEQVLEQTGADAERHVLLDDRRDNCQMARSRGCRAHQYRGRLPKWLAENRSE